MQEVVDCALKLGPTIIQIMEGLIKALDVAIWEMGEGFKGLQDTDVWRRPHPRLLSVGEIAVHVAYWEAKTFLPDTFKSELLAEAGRYYSTNVDAPFELAMGAEAVYNEVKRVHEVCMAEFRSEPRDMTAPHPSREGWTWESILTYQAFHIAYHTGQIYSARHLMGHDTEDN